MASVDFTDLELELVDLTLVGSVSFVDVVGSKETVDLVITRHLIHTVDLVDLDIVFLAFLNQ